MWHNHFSDVFFFLLLGHLEFSNSEVRVDSFINSDLRTHVARRLADGGLSSSGDLGTDREDSPLQSKRSSMFEILHI